MSDTDESPMLLAAEYALGSLDVAEMREAEALAARDPAFAGEVVYWQDRLSALANLITPVQPPPDLWSRLALAIGASENRVRSRPGVWQATTALSLAIAAGLTLFAFLPRPPGSGSERLAAALSPIADPARFLAETRPDGSIAVTNLGGPAAPAGRDFELWALPTGATAPIPLGVLNTAPRVVRLPQGVAAQGQLLISDEPAGGSPTGAPTGAVLFGGRLVSLSPAATPGR